MPNSSAASSPNVGTPTTASHAPEAVAATARDTARDIAATPPHATALPLTNPPSGSRGTRGSTTGSIRMRLNGVADNGSASRWTATVRRDADVISLIVPNGCSQVQRVRTRLVGTWDAH